MIKFKLFFKSTEKEEEWIDKVQKSGYTFTGINSFLPAFYYFKRDKEKDKMSIKMDFKKYISKDDYANYITLFEDSGWIHAFAHGADLLTEIVKMKYFSKDDSLKILTIIKRVMITDDILTLNG
ncbi:TPA: DUF2812 domain-containing protein [Streptococcus agalactiae]